SVAALAVPRRARRLGLALDADPERTIALNLLRPELTALKPSLAAGRADRVHVELTQVRMTHQQPGQVVRNAEALCTGRRNGLRQRLLCLDGHVEAVLDIVLLTTRVRYRLAILAQRPAEHAGDHGALRERRRRRAALSRWVTLDNQDGLSAVLDV